MQWLLLNYSGPVIITIGLMEQQGVDRCLQRRGEKRVSGFFIRCTLVIITIVWIFISIPIIIILIAGMIILWVMRRVNVCCFNCVGSFPEFLTTTELYWLYASNGAPSTVQCRIGLDRYVTVKSIRDIIVTRIMNLDRRRFGTYTRLKKCLVKNWMTCSWRADAEFAIDNHVTEIRGKFISELDVSSHIAQMSSKELDFRRPLWNVEVLHSGWNNTTSLLIRTHPCFADGSTLVELLCKSFSDNYVSYKMAGEQDQTHPVVSLMSGILLGPILLAYFRFQNQRSRTDVFQGMSPSMQYSVASSRPIAFKKLVESKTVANCSISDFVLSAATGTVRSCFLKNTLQQFSLGDIRADLLYRYSDCSSACSVTCSPRVPWNPHYGKIPVRLPLNTEGIIPRLWDTLRCTRKLRQYCADSIASGVLQCVMNIMPSGPAARWLSETLGCGKCLISNLDGPERPVSISGAFVTDITNWFPPGNYGFISLCVLTYNDELRVGVTVDNCLNTKASTLAEEFAIQIETLISFLAHRRFLRKSSRKKEEVEDVDEFDDYPDFDPEIGLDRDVTCENDDWVHRDSTILNATTQADQPRSSRTSSASQSRYADSPPENTLRGESVDEPTCSTTAPSDNRLFVKSAHAAGPNAESTLKGPSTSTHQLQQQHQHSDVMIHVVRETAVTSLESLGDSSTDDVERTPTSDKIGPYNYDRTRRSSTGMTVITSVAVRVLDMSQSFEFSPCVERRGSSATIAEV